MSISETDKFRHLTTKYCVGDGIDIGSAGEPVVPSAIQVELPTPYSTLGDMSRINLHGTGRNLNWFADRVLDYVYSSHLLEDFADWPIVVTEWCRPVKVGGYLIILVPEQERWEKAVAGGQPDNTNHQHVFALGELSDFIRRLGGWSVVSEEMPDPNDYGIVFIARRER